MNGRKQRRRVLSGLLALASIGLVAALVGYALGRPAPPSPQRFFLSNPGGDVVFDHSAHAEMLDCGDCHHVAAMVEDAEPASCRNCHPSASPEGAAVSACTACHDADDGYEAGMLEHEELLAIHGEDCGSCHAARSVNTVYHQGCSDCHLEVDPEAFAAEDGSARCARCHLR